MAFRGWNYITEFLGTFLLVLVVLLSNSNPLVVGGTLSAILYFSRGRSGGDVNPAISMVKFLGGNLDGRDFVAYTASQIGGAITCLYIFKMFM